MIYSIEFAKEAAADLETLHNADRKLFNRLLAKIESLAQAPFEGKQFVGNHKGEYSLRVGNYRIIYELHAAKHIVFVLTVKHRRHVY
jgi:mRNA interferase RelE/StbE